MTDVPRTVGVVAIGRNEGERLVGCLESLRGSGTVVYVDSGSSDGSLDRARDAGARTVELDMDRPFTAARARNAGFEALMEANPDVEFVQFVDGDCEVQPDWVPAAADYLGAHADVSVVCGRRRERHPDATLYNRLTDVEWDTPVGESHMCGGDSLMRVAAFRRAGGFDGTLIAGEEPDLCLRIRQAGGRIMRLDREMTLHDAQLVRFGQWWRRQVRSGHAYADLVGRHGNHEPRWQRRLLSIVLWGCVVPVLALLPAWPTGGLSCWLLLGYGWLAWRLWQDVRRRGIPTPLARAYVLVTVLGKFAEFEGVCRYAWNRWARRRSTTLIEYKQT